MCEELGGIGGEIKGGELESGEPAIGVEKLLGARLLPWVAAMDGEGGCSGERVK